MAAAGSVIVRAKNEAATIAAALSSLRDQTVDVEIVVVDSGSTDGTLEIARRWCDQLIEIPPEEFSFGRALNLGAEAASAPIHFALSAHCVAPREDWIERSLRHYERSDIAATNGALLYPDRRPLRETFHQDAETARRFPLWGFSNHAASWRAEVWEVHRFNEAMVACEDKEWSWRVLADGWLIAYDPLLCISTAHRERSGVRSFFNRTERESRELATYGAFPEFGVRDALRAWWNGYPEYSRYPPLMHRVNYYRIAEIIARYIGSRRGRRIAGVAQTSGSVVGTARR